MMDVGDSVREPDRKNGSINGGDLFYDIFAFSILYADNDHIFSPILFELQTRLTVKYELRYDINCHLKISFNHSHMEHFYIKNYLISFTEKPPIISLPYVNSLLHRKIIFKGR